MIVILIQDPDTDPDSDSEPRSTLLYATLHYTLRYTAWLAQLLNAPTQMHAQSCTVEIQLHSRADSLTRASILPRSVK